MSSFSVITILVVSLIVSNIYWMIHVQILVNKIMSRSFAEYNRVIKPPVKQPASFHVEQPDDLSVLDSFKI